MDFFTTSFSRNFTISSLIPRRELKIHIMQLQDSHFDLSVINAKEVRRLFNKQEERVFRGIEILKHQAYLHLLKVCYTLGGFHYFYTIHSFSLCGVEVSVCCLEQIVCCQLTLAVPVPNPALFGCPRKCSAWKCST